MREAVRIAIAINVIGLWCIAAGAQTTPLRKTTNSVSKPPPLAEPKPGVVSGRIFLITKGGDIKPARLAQVYLMLWYGVVSPATAGDWSASQESIDKLKESTDSSAAGMWFSAHHKALQEYTDKLWKSQWNESAACKMQLLTYDEATNAVLNSGTPKQLTVLIGQADEEGNFKIANVQPGSYIIVASGRAGFNEARWQESSLAVKPGIETAIKLASPSLACLDLQ